MAIAGRAKKVTTHTLQEMKAAGEKITMLTSYDYSLARLVDGAGIDTILVGDSASNVMAGNETTVPITLDHMIYHAQCVVNGVDRALVVVDMPFGTYGVRAKGDDEAERLISDALALQEAGCFALVLEKIPADLAKAVSEKLTIPTIGIGAGPDCDGQVLVLHDMLGITKDFSPRFLRRYADVGETVDGAVKQLSLIHI